jgi:hypothetical protein
MSRPGAFPGPDKQTLLYNSVMAACDGQDGIEDKIISNVAGCHFDPPSAPLFEGCRYRADLSLRPADRIGDRRVHTVQVAVPDSQR